MTFSSPNLTIIDMMRLLQRWIIVQSILYYEMDFNLVEDSVYDENSNQLMLMIREFPEEYKQTAYYYCMNDFDGNTGFDIRSRLTNKDHEYLTHTATMLKGRFSEVKKK